MARIRSEDHGQSQTACATQLYQQAQADLMESYNAKLQELQGVKEEVSLASQSLINQPWERPSLEELADVAGQLGDLQTTFAEGSQVGSLIDSVHQRATFPQAPRSCDLCPADAFALWWPEVQMQCADSQDRRPTFFDTWFLSVGEAHLCVRSRRAKVDRQMAFVDFKKACVGVWHELFNGQQLHFSVIDGQPAGLPSTVAHILTVQGEHAGYNAILMKGNTLPPLLSWRAVLYDRTIRVNELFHLLQI